jgi:p-hydroxybenzoate 3-monooxygenase
MCARRTQVGIIGAGPAGLTLAQLLDLNGVESVVLERRSRDYVLGRVRAGVIEQGVVAILREARVAARLDREGIVHHGVEIALGERREHIDFGPQGASLTVYGQTELTKDLIEARDAAGSPPIFDVDDVVIDGVATERPRLLYRHDGAQHAIDCDFIAGCDGFHGVSRKSIPPSVLKIHERVYPFGWLGVLADVPPVSPELIYVSHERGFALCSMRSASRSRCYVQCDVDIDLDEWSDARFWDELRSLLPAELAAKLVTGPSLEKSVAPLRSFVAEPLRHGRLFIAGDAAHIVPPTGAKGLNLAVRDVRQLADAIVAHYRDGRDELLDVYSAAALRRIWRAERFSAWLTSVLHRFPGRTSFDRGMQLAELDNLASSAAARAAFIEAYTGVHP